MSLFNVEIERKKKTTTYHPWEKTVRSNYANKIKYLHNSCNNPIYPGDCKKKLKNISDQVRAKFKIIGDMCSKEFIYCVKVATGLHKYRWRNFEAPVIRGVPSAEWPQIRQQKILECQGESCCEVSSVIVIFNNKFLGGVKELQKLVESKYIYYLCYTNNKECIDAFAKFVKSSGRPFVYMHISIDERHVGTLIFMLYGDIVPQTCENFLRLCNKKKGGYSGTPVHRIVKDCWIQCGGFTLKKTDLMCENFIAPLDQRGVLGMANDGPNIDCSTQFFVLLQPQPWMAYKYVAFGKLIDGEATLKAIEEVPTWYESPTRDVIIYQTGILNLECQDIMINPNANDYIERHIEDLFILGEFLQKELIARVFAEIELRYQQKTAALCEEEIKEDCSKSSKDLEVEDYEDKSDSDDETVILSDTIIQPMKKFYIALADVPYEDEKDSEYDIKKFLRGDYCHESDLSDQVVKAPKIPLHYILGGPQLDVIMESRTQSIADDPELTEYLKQNIDRMSFSGAVIRKICRNQGAMNIFDNVTRSQMINLTDEELRRLRLIEINAQAKTKKNVKLTGPEPEHGKVNRRPTAFLRKEDVAEIMRAHKNDDEHDDEDHKKNVVLTGPEPERGKVNRRPTGFLRKEDLVGLLHAHKKDDEDDDEDQEKFKAGEPQTFTHPDDFDENIKPLILDRQTKKQAHAKFRSIGALELVKYMSTTGVNVDDEENETPRMFKRRRPTGYVSGLPPDEDDDYEEEEEETEDKQQTNVVKVSNQTTESKRTSGYPAFDDKEDNSSDDEPTSRRCSAQGQRRRNRIQSKSFDYDSELREITFARLLEASKHDYDEAPTLKNYRPITEAHPKNMFLTMSQPNNLKNNKLDDQKTTDKFLRRSLSAKNEKFDLQHVHRVFDKISNDYVSTLDFMEHWPVECSLRSLEYNKLRPMLTVAQYQARNKKYREMAESEMSASSVATRACKITKPSKQEIKNKIEAKRNRLGYT